MDRIKLTNHKKRGDTLHTPFTDPDGLGVGLQLSSWSKNWLPEYLWIGLIIYKLGRKKGLEQLYHIIEILDDKELCIPQLSKISMLPKEKRRLFWDVVFSYVSENNLSSLSLVITSDIDSELYYRCFDFSVSIDDNLSDLMEIIKQCSRFHDELTTDICFIVDWFYIKSGRLHISSQLDMLPEALSQYYKFSHEEEIMRTYRPIIRSTFQGVTPLDSDKSWSRKIWIRLGEISECNPLVIEWEANNKMEYYLEAKDVIEYISATNEDKKMDTKYSVIMGITSYIFKLYSEIVEKGLFNDISGRIVFRSMIEAYINLKYIMLQEAEVEDIYDRFKAYGIGKIKLIMAKLREEKYRVSNEAQMDEKLLELLVNEDMDEMFVQMSLGFFDRTNINKKFSECGEQMLYEIFYEYGTNYAHAFWGAIRESTMLICDNPSHDYHAVPDYDKKQNLKSIDADCTMIMKKVFSQIAEYIDLPEFYLNKHQTLGEE